MYTFLPHHPLYMAIFWIAYAIWGIPEILGAIRQNSVRVRKEARREDRGSYLFLMAMLYIGLFLAFIAVYALPVATIAWHQTVIFFIGIAAILLGVALRWYAIWTLGRYFTRDVAVSPDQQIVQHGPYRYIRHPAYSGSLLTVVGVGLALLNWASLIMLVVCTFIGYLYRVRVEEQALCQTIGQPYRDYMRRTRRFIPFVL